VIFPLRLLYFVGVELMLIKGFGHRMVIWIKILSFNLKAFAALVNVSNHIFIGGFAVVGDAVGVVNGFIKANSVIDIVGVAANVVIDTAD